MIDQALRALSPPELGGLWRLLHNQGQMGALVPVENELIRRARKLSQAYKGGPGSGYHGHAGRPGHQGGSAPRGGGGGGSTSGRSYLKGDYFDEEAEGSAVMEGAGPQSSRLRPGATREQLARFYARRDAFRKAEATRYQGGESVRQAVDRLIKKGYRKPVTRGRWTTLEKPGEREGDTDAYRFSTAVERDYIALALNRGKFKRNY